MIAILCLDSILHCLPLVKWDYATIIIINFKFKLDISAIGKTIAIIVHPARRNVTQRMIYV